jgi:xanthine dehydrogenase accessory factor
LQHLKKHKNKAGELEHVAIDQRTVFVLMSHNYNYDLELLKLLLQTSCSYICTLGPKKRLERMLTELDEQGVLIADRQREKIYGPTGINIGAEAAEEIALSVLAEIKAVLSNHHGTFLRDRSEAIHSRLPVETTVEI